MSVPVQTPSKEYIANGTTTAFPLEFNCDKAEYLIVTLNGEEAPIGSWTLANDTVTFNVAPLNGVVVNLERNTPFQRTTNYQLYDNSFRPSAVNKDFDLIWWKLQELGYRDQVIWLALVKEIADRIAGDDNLQNQINTIDEWLANLQQNVNENTNDIAQLINDLSKEIADRITGDQILKDMFISMIDEAINEGTINALAITHLDSLEALEGVTNVWDGRTIYIKDLGNYRYDASTTTWVKAYQDADNVKDGSESQMQINDKSVRVFESIADLLTYTPRKDGQVVYVKGYHNPTNFALAKPYVGGGHRVYVASRAAENDGFLCINGWVLQIEKNTVTPEQAGCHGDNTHDDYTQLQKVLKSELKVECNPFANYRTSKPIELFSSQKIKGNGAKITKYSASTTGITGRTDPAGNLYDYDQDCAVVFAAWFGWYSHIDIENLTIVKEKVNGEDVGKVFFAPYISLSTLKSVVVKGGEYGFYGEDLWMLHWNRCESYSKCGFYIGTGTSNTFDTCWSKETKAGYSAFRLHNLTYSSLINCCAENVGEDGAPADAAYHITSSDLTMTGCGIEGIHAYNLVRIGYSWVTIDNPSFIYGINNKYRHETYTGLIDIDNSDSVVTLRGGRIANINSGVFADAVRVNGGTFNYETPLWTNVGFPDDSSAFKIRIANYAAIMDLTDFTGRKYTFNGRGQKWDVHTKTKFLNGLQANPLGTTQLSNIRKDFYIGTQNNGSNGSTANGYPFDGFGGTVINFSDDDAAQYSNTCQLALSAVSNKVFFRRAAYEQPLGAWYEFRTTANTTVDSNGFIKAASPILKLFADKIELNDEAAEQNIIFEKLGVGDYLIKNSTGFSNEGWYIETPKDANGNVLVAVVYEQLSNNNISVKTYAKKFDEETGDVVPNLSKPRDIPESRWITLRLQELPKPEQEIEPVN